MNLIRISAVRNFVLFDVLLFGIERDGWLLGYAVKQHGMFLSYS